MAFQQLVGSGIWSPVMQSGTTATNVISTSDLLLMDADEEESQIIGVVKIDGGGTKTFGTSGSKIGWLPGAAITFLINSQLTVGIKKSSTIDTANGPPSRATVGAAAFSVSKQLVGGTDTITSTTWREDTMNAGTPFSVSDGDMIAVCFHLNSTAGSPSIKVRGSTPGAVGFPSSTLVTGGGATFTNQFQVPNLIITFDDGTLGWVDSSLVFSVADTASATIGNGNIFGNIFRFPFPCQVDALAATLNANSATANYNIELYDSPLGTPTLIESVARDANVQARNGSLDLIIVKLTTARTLAANTDYAVGVKQTTANAVAIEQRDNSVATYMRANGGGGENCYAANSTAGGTFVAQNSGKRRYHAWVRISALDDGAGFPVTVGVRSRRD